MTLRIDYKSQKFPASCGVGSGTLTTSWNDLLWAALTIGRPSTYHVFRHGPASFHEAIFRLSLVRMAVSKGINNRLRRTSAFAALDPTEKGMVSYFLGMTLCKLFADKLLFTPWLLHLDVFRQHLATQTLGRSRPDLVGFSNGKQWHAFECKGRSTLPTSGDKDNAKKQADRLISVGGQKCSLHIGSFAFFRDDILEFYWRDPEPESSEELALPEPTEEWRYCFEPALALSAQPEEAALASEMENADVTVSIHPRVAEMLGAGRWLEAQRLAVELRDELAREGYKPDGLKVSAGPSWGLGSQLFEQG